MFLVTEEAMRPASTVRQCFYCHQPIGAEHMPSCVLILKKVKVRLTVDYTVEVPASWDKQMIEFHRNDSSRCASNAIRELEAIQPCLCSVASFEYIGTLSSAFLSEK